MNSTNYRHSKYSFNLMAKPYGPTCNLSCEYCFYLKKSDLFDTQDSTKLKMSDEVLEQFIKSYIDAQPTAAKEINFSWQGGEPTLRGTNFFQKALSLQSKHNKRNLKINNLIQTNGTLIDEQFSKFLKDNNFLVGISIDGNEEQHNHYRKLTNGVGSFSRVMNGLENLKKYNVDFNTLTVVNNINSQAPQETYTFLKNIGSKFIQFIPLVEPSNLKNQLVTNRSVEPVKWGIFLTSIFKEWYERDLGSVFIQIFDLILGLYLGLPSTLCVHSKYCGKSLAIEHNGDIYSCDHFVTPENHLGSIVQNLPEVISSKKQIKFGLNKFDTLPKKCVMCDYLKLCYGGCPKDRLLRTQTGNLNYLCKGYYNFYKDTYPVFTELINKIKGNMPSF